MPLCGKCLIHLLCELSPQIMSPDPGKLCFDWAAAPTSHVLSSSDIADLPALSFLLPPSLPWIFLLFLPSQMWCCIGSSVSWMWILVRCWAITRIDLLHLANLGMLKRSLFMSSGSVCLHEVVSGEGWCHQKWNSMISFSVEMVAAQTVCCSFMRSCFALCVCETDAWVPPLRIITTATHLSTFARMSLLIPGESGSLASCQAAFSMIWLFVFLYGIKTACLSVRDRWHKFTN